MSDSSQGHVSERFARLLALYRKPDGSEWCGQDLERATGEAMTRSPERSTPPAGGYLRLGSARSDEQPVRRRIVR